MNSHRRTVKFLADAFARGQVARDGITLLTTTEPAKVDLSNLSREHADENYMGQNNGRERRVTFRDRRL